MNSQMFKLDLEMAEEPEIKLPASVWSWEKQENFRKTSTSASLTMLKPLSVWITINYGKLFKKWEYQTTLPGSIEICMQVKKQQLELDMEQWTGSKLGKEYNKAAYCHCAYLTYMLDEAQARIKIVGEMLITSDMQNDTTLMAESNEELKNLLMKVKDESEKAVLKLNIQ